MKTTSILTALCLLSTIIMAQPLKQGPSVDFSKGQLTVSEDGRFLVHRNGDPFFYLGDTAWELFHRLSREEAEQYLENRRSKGFTVILAVVLAELNGLNVPNYYGDKPLINNDIHTPNEAYFQHVDWIIKKAEEKGLYIGLLPTWGDKVDKERWGTGPVIFNPETAAVYGQWIANRYRDQHNIIWINGGDRSGGEGNTETWNALGNAIKSVDQNHLMTYHPFGGHSSSEWFHQQPWLDFNMMQSGHSDRFIPNYRQIQYDRNLTPVKPTLDGEPCYEDHAINWNPDFGWFDAADVRQQAYWGILSGSCGTTYGAHPIWQFYDEVRQPVTHARLHWKKAMDLPGAFDMLHVRNLFESRNWLDMQPAQEILAGTGKDPAQMIMAGKGKDFAIIYAPAISDIQINQDALFGTGFLAWWYNPRTGEANRVPSGDIGGNTLFRPAVTGIDWVLVIDNETAGYPPPGAFKH